MLSSYRTALDEASEQIVVKKSKFICFLKPIQSEEEALEYLSELKKKYYDARHHCYAYRLILEEEIERFNDDKEPAGTAGKPILEVLKGAGVHNVMAVVIRYFGGVLLGTGGLIRAYSESVKEALSKIEPYEFKLCERLLFVTDYGLLPKLEYEIHKNNLMIENVDYGENVELSIFVERPIVDKIIKVYMDLTNGKGHYKFQGLYYVSNQASPIIFLEINKSNC
jgi:uncharacterized YigZ family protein